MTGAALRRSLERALRNEGADLVAFADLSGVAAARALGCGGAVLLGLALPPAFLRRFHRNLPTADEYLVREQRVEALADRLAERLTAEGHRALSLSEQANLARGHVEGGFADPELRVPVSPVPQKTVARLAGVGFVGKNNLLVTQAYGCALAICSVLTDAPLRPPAARVIPPRCGQCRACVDACPTRALSGRTWSAEDGREALLDRSRCACPLRCMVSCPWTLRYAGER